MPLFLMHTISDARARWLGGDADAWAHYVACCLRLDAEHRAHRHTDRAPEPRDEASRPPVQPTQREA